MKLAILSRAPRSYSTQRLRTAALERGHKVKVLDTLRFAIDLSDNLASAKMLIPVDPDMPVMGGRTLRINAGLELAYRNNQPIVKLRGVSIMGVPLPNAWLGNMKNVDLVEQFGTDPGFWNSFSAGVDMIEIEEGQLHIQLKE